MGYNYDERPEDMTPEKRIKLKAWKMIEEHREAGVPQMKAHLAAATTARALKAQWDQIAGIRKENENTRPQRLAQFDALIAAILAYLPVPKKKDAATEEETS